MNSTGSVSTDEYLRILVENSERKKKTPLIKFEEYNELGGLNGLGCKVVY